MISTRDLEWCAGFLEGEGSFCARKGYAPATSASQVQLEPLIRLQRLLGGRITRLRRKPGSRYEGYPDFYQWRASGAAVMMTMYCLMSTRRQGQIRNALSIWRSMRPASKFRTSCPGGHPLVGANLYIRYDSSGGPHRSCRACAKIAWRRWYDTKKLAAGVV